MPAKAAAPAAPTFEFHAILEGGKTAKPAAAVKPQEVWWLQVAALRQAADAEQLRSRLALANMEATVVPVQSGDNTLYRVRVGPFKTEAAAKTVADLLLKNNLEPRLLKEPVQP
jgi:cell division protein FtsN